MRIQNRVFFIISIQIVIDCYRLESHVLIYGNLISLLISQTLRLVLEFCIGGIISVVFLFLLEHRIGLLVIEGTRN